LEGLKKSPPLALFLVGDIFDLWVSDFDYFKFQFRSLIEVLRELSLQNVRMVYFQGNHDLYLEPFWGEELGFEVYRDPKTFELMGEKFFVEHGDLMNPDDKGYLFLRKVLNTPWVEAGIKKLPGPVVKVVGERASSASRRVHPHRPEHDQRIKKMIRAHALKRHQETGCKFVITGHVHVEDEWWSEGREVCSINLGSWHHSPKVWRWSLNSFGFEKLPASL
jgi:UDP-2,3-diacylglucosamine hydrolase